MSEALEKAATECARVGGCGCSLDSGEFVLCCDPRLPVEDAGIEIRKPRESCACLRQARAAITAFLSEVEPEALARAWKPFAFDEADSYYPYRGQIRKSAIYDASEMLAALRKLMNPDKSHEDVG